MKQLFALCLSLFLLFSQNSQAALWHEGKDYQSRLLNKDLKSLSPKAYAKVAKVNASSVVNIRVNKEVARGNAKSLPFGPNLNEEFFERFFGFKGPQNMPKQEKKGLGSGFVISQEGYIVTNNHVVDGATRIVVIFSDEKEYDAQIIGQDPKTDLALLKIKDKNKRQFPAVILGDSDVLEVGDIVIAIGNPFGLSHTTTQGIVSAKERSIGISEYDDLIQTDASINPGNSGGPLLNIHGEVIGINTAIIASGQGLGFAIPINMAKSILSSLKEKGKVERSWLGVQIQQITKDEVAALRLKKKQGALISEVIKGSPADKAGFKVGDVIVQFDNKMIEKFSQLPAQVAISRPGKTIPVQVIRDGKSVLIKVKLEKREDEKLTETKVSQYKDNSDALGMVVASHKVKGKKAGVKVVKIKSKSQAFKKGLVAGDIILQFNKKNMKSIEDYKKQINALKNKDYVLMHVQKRQGTKVFIAFQYDKEKN